MWKLRMIWTACWRCILTTRKVVVQEAIPFGMRPPWPWCERLLPTWWIFITLQEAPRKKLRSGASAGVTQLFQKLENSLNSYLKETIKIRVFLKLCLKIMPRSMAWRILPCEIGQIFRTIRTKHWIQWLLWRRLSLPSLIFNPSLI